MGDVIDMRPDRFLHELRETGKWDIACTKSGMSGAEVEQLCQINSKFDLAQIECHLEFIEEKLIEIVAEQVTRLHDWRKANYTQTRTVMLESWFKRHTPDHG